ncbi:tripartite tricarboxylate transporter substrate binding protein [Bordetella sp. LUAb4]|uniref:Bug family tripartite tricarboxylate transporter substrate binding protein n=1 Tax=Bordetella sp. LUAb4 TaxID=2843195 RepID=UPI001E4E80F5|nr:tripartite tricarboxylate transporter substrate binding protein [Bordetella sp. LUAb4]
MKIGFSIKALCASLAFASVLAAAPTLAAYPDRPVQMVIGYPPGGSADAVARPLSVLLSKYLEQSVVVEYKAGAGAIIGTQTVARANPDGYTVGLVLAAHAINPSLYKLPYDTAKDFTPIGKVASLPLALYVNSKFPVKTVQEFIDYAKKKPGEVSMASSGNGNTSHLAIELLSSMAGIRVLHVPFKGGGPAQSALMGAQVDGLFDGPYSMNMVTTGRARLLGFASKERLSIAPEIPTIAESGVPNFEVSGWYGLIGPAGMPKEVVAKLNDAMRKAVADPKFKEIVEPLGYVIEPSSPEEFGAYVAQEQARWSDVIRKANIKLD